MKNLIPLSILSKCVARIKSILFAFLLLLACNVVNAQTVIQVGTGSVAPSVGSNPGAGANGASPYGICVGSGNMGKIVQIIYTANDINAALTAASLSTSSPYFISTTSWDISSNIGSTNYSHAGYTINMANIAATSFTGTTPYSGAMTQVFSAAVSFGSSGTGYLVTNTLSSSFQWDGSSSLLVQVCYTISSVGLATTYGGCRRTTETNNQMLYNGGASISCATSSYAVAVAAIPNCKMTVTAATPCSGAPSVSTASTIQVCPSATGVESLTGLVGGSGYTYLWKQSNSSTYPGSFAAASGTNTGATYTTPIGSSLPYSPTYYVCEVTCSNSGMMTPSNAGNASLSSFLNCYCVYGSFTAPSSSIHIQNVNLQGASVLLNNNPTAPTSSPYYTVYSSPVPDLALSGTYSLKVTVGTSTRRNNVAAWIDWDQNGVFGNNANEFIGTATQIGAVQTTWTVNVPPGAIPGTTAMRVVYDNINGSSNGFSNSSPNCTFAATGGETEDYRVLVFGGCTTPTTQASAFVTDPNPTTTSCSVMFTRGNGNGGMLVVAKAGSAPTGPISGTSYTANSQFGLGSSTDANLSWVVYNSSAGTQGTQEAVPVTGLTAGTTYYFAAYEWNMASTCYDLISPPGGSVAIPLCIQPTMQVSGVTVPTINTTNATLSWAVGNGDHTLILLKQGSAVSSSPALTTTYTDNLNYNYGSPAGSQIGTGNYVMFGDAGTANATTATITGLFPSTQYFYAVYTYFSATHCYYLTSPVTGSFTTASCSPSPNASGIAFSGITNNAVTATWTRGGGNDVLVVARLTATTQVKPIYNTSYTTNTTFGSGTGTAITGTGNFVVYNGTGTTVNITGMANLTSYTFDLYEYAASPNCYTTTSASGAVSTLDGTTSGGCSASVVRTQTSQSRSVHNDASYTAIAPATVIDNVGSTTGYYDGGAINTPGAGIPIGFNFVYNGVTYTSFGLGVNGYIWFTQNGAVPAPSATSPISNASPNLGGSGTIDGLICANGILLYTGNVTSGQSIGYTLSGVAPSRVLKIQWKGYAISGSYSLCNNYSYVDGNRLDFQIILNEDGGSASDQIGLAYADQDPYCAYGDNASAQVGIRGTDNTTFTNRTGANGSWANTAGANNAATSTISSYIAGNVLVTFTQAITTGPTVSVGSLNCPAGTVTLTAGSGFTTFQWYNGANIIPGPGSNLQSYSASASATYSVVGKNGSCYLQSLQTPVTVGSCSIAYNFKLFIQGYYLGNSAMSPLLHLLDPIDWASNVVDTFTVEIRDQTVNHNLVESHSGLVLHTDGTVSATLTNTGSYWVVVKHRNSIYTWSGSAVAIAANGTYDFTTAASQAYGSNEANLDGVVYGIYSGDVVRDDAQAINSADKIQMQSVLSTFSIGVYNVNDITGDGFVDDEDYRILQNNIPLGIIVRHP